MHGSERCSRAQTAESFGDLGAGAGTPERVRGHTGAADTVRWDVGPCQCAEHAAVSAAGTSAATEGDWVGDGGGGRIGVDGVGDTMNGRGCVCQCVRACVCGCSCGLRVTDAARPVGACRCAAVALDSRNRRHGTTQVCALASATLTSVVTGARGVLTQRHPAQQGGAGRVRLGSVASSKRQAKLTCVGCQCAGSGDSDSRSRRSGGFCCTGCAWRGHRACKQTCTRKRRGKVRGDGMPAWRTRSRGPRPARPRKARCAGLSAKPGRARTGAEERPVCQAFKLAPPP